MKIATLNINSINARLPNLLQWLQQNQPDILLADEPTGNLDKASAQEIIQLLLDLNKAGHTIILVTHDEQFARLCPRKITLSDGQIVADMRR